MVGLTAGPSLHAYVSVKICLRIEAFLVVRISLNFGESRFLNLFEQLPFPEWEKAQMKLAAAPFVKVLENHFPRTYFYRIANHFLAAVNILPAVPEVPFQNSFFTVQNILVIPLVDNQQAAPLQNVEKPL